jgi:hypothetical protein
MSKEMIDAALEKANDTKACVISNGALERVPGLFLEHFENAASAIIICDPRTLAAAGERVEELLKNSGVEVSRYVLEPDGKTFHADYFMSIRFAMRSLLPLRRGLCPFPSPSAAAL